MGRKEKAPEFEIVEKTADPSEVTDWLGKAVKEGRPFFIIVADVKQDAFSVRSNIAVRDAFPLLHRILLDMWGHTIESTYKIVGNLERQVRKGLK